MTADLSELHHPVSSFLSLPTTPEEWQKFAISTEDLAFFEENGYVAGIRVLSEEQVDTLREELSRLVDTNHPNHDLFHEFHSNESNDPSKVLFHALGAWRIEKGFHDLLWHPAWSVPASQLLGGAVRFWHDQLFCKPAQDGGVVAWHQDYSYWTRTKPMAHLTCWIALDDATAENGCIQYVPGSHKWDLLPVTGLAGDMDAIQSVLSEEQREQFQPVKVELKKGEASFHHPLLVHGSGDNSSDRPRRAVVINSFRDGTKSDTDEPLLQGIPAIQSGQSLTGQFFPVVIDPNVVGLVA